MRNPSYIESERGFSLIEMMTCLVIFIPLMGAAMSLFSVGARQQATEQDAIEVNQEARAALEMMAMEIAQAGSHGDRSTTTSAAITVASANVQSVAVASTAGLNAGDTIDVDNGSENVTITAISGNYISGVFRSTHPGGVPIRLFATPYQSGVIAPAGLGPNSSTTVTTLRFFGDINGDGNLNYVEYVYDANNARITRSMTPIAQASKGPAIPILNNIRANSAQFTLHTDSRSVVTSVTISLTVQNTIETGTKYQETALASKIMIPSAVAASELLKENLLFGGINRFPPTPNKIIAWAN